MRVVFVFIAGLIFTPQVLAVNSDCRLCHMSKALKYLPAKHRPTKQHADFNNHHGKAEISCHQCHEANNHNLLRTSPDFPATFENPSPVCQRCHFDIFKDWSRGMHGKRTGNWDGAKKVLACVDCHSPHRVSFAPMKAEPPPQKPKLGVEKDHE